MDKIFQLDIDPVGKGRPRVTSFGGRPRMYTPAKTRSFENAIGRVASRHLEKIDGPLRVDILAITTRPKRLKRKKDSDKVIYRTTKPDADNVRKAVLDGLSPFFDDKQVVSGETFSLYSEKEGKGRVVIRVTLSIGDPVEEVGKIFQGYLSS